MLLLLKALRAIWRNKKTYFACVCLIALGTMQFINFNISSQSLTQAKLSYYEDTNMADAFATVKGMSRSEVDGVRIDGIKTVDAKMALSVHPEIEEAKREITLQLMTENDNLNQIVMQKGEYLSDERDILMSQSFLDAWDIKIGDEIEVRYKSKIVKLRISGTFLSPEYIYIIAGAQQIMPMEDYFNIAIVSEDLIESLSGDKMYTNISFQFEDGVTFDDVKYSIEDELTKYGLKSSVELEDQVSNSMLDSEIDGINAMGNSVPLVFIAMSIVILYLMLKRIIEQDRAIIGTLKAFGFTDFKVLMHYSIYGTITGVVGGIVGSIAGFFMSGMYLSLYKDFFKMPELVRYGLAKPMIIGFFIATIGGFLGSIAGAKGTLELKPADSMRAPIPTYKSKNSGNSFIQKFLSPTQKMAWRSMGRNKVRTAFVVGGVCFSFAILTFMGSYSTMITDMLDSQFKYANNYDGRVSFITPVREDSAINTVYSTDGIQLAEGVLNWGAEIKVGSKTESASITALHQGATLIKAHDTEEDIDCAIPEEGFVLPKKMADKLGVKKGDVVEINDKQVKVSEVIVQSINGSIYVDIDYFRDIMGFDDIISSVVVKGDTKQLEEDCNDAANVSAFMDIASIRNQMNDMLAPYTNMVYIFLLLGILIAFAICYNTASIAIMERKREYSTLRVLGMQVKEVAGIIGFEYWLLGVLGMILGVPTAKLLKVALSLAVDVDQFEMPTNVEFSHVLIGVVCTCLAIAWSNYSAVKQVRKMDMVEVLKERE